MLKSTFELDGDAIATPALAPDPMELPQLAQECLARAQIYRCLSAVFIEEPSAVLLASMREVTWLQALGTVGVTFQPDFLETDLETLTDTLACEYTTLFASSGGFPPIESVRLTGRYKQEPHYQVSALYQRLGFEQVKGQFDVFADQLGMELLFLAEMLERCADSLHREDVTAFKQLDKEIKRFWTLHLGRWVRGYSQLITRAANHSFYREMARFLNGFATEEINAMGLTRLEDLDQGQLVVPKSDITLEFNPDEPVCGECPPELAEKMDAQGKRRVIPISAIQDLAL